MRAAVEEDVSVVIGEEPTADCRGAGGTVADPAAERHDLAEQVALGAERAGVGGQERPIRRREVARLGRAGDARLVPPAGAPEVDRIEVSPRKPAGAQAVARRRQGDVVGKGDKDGMAVVLQHAGAVRQPGRGDRADQRPPAHGGDFRHVEESERLERGCVERIVWRRRHDRDVGVVRDLDIGAETAAQSADVPETDAGDGHFRVDERPVGRRRGAVAGPEGDERRVGAVLDEQKLPFVICLVAGHADQRAFDADVAHIQPWVGELRDRNVRHGNRGGSAEAPDGEVVPDDEAFAARVVVDDVAVDADAVADGGKGYAALGEAEPSGLILDYELAVLENGCHRAGHGEIPALASTAQGGPAKFVRPHERPLRGVGITSGKADGEKDGGERRKGSFGFQHLLNFTIKGGLWRRYTKVYL